MKKLIIIALSFLLTGCGWLNDTKLYLSAPDVPVLFYKSVQKPFHNINCQGTLIVRLDGKKKTPWLAVNRKGYVYAYVQNDTLYLKPVPRENKEGHGPIWSMVTINGVPIKDLNISGRCRVLATNAHGYAMNIRARGNAFLHLEGVFGVKSITSHDHANVNVTFLKAHQLTVWAFNKSRLKLAGTAKILRAKVDNEAQADMRYLRGKDVYVKTSEQALARVTPTERIWAFATNQSNIYYYKTPGPNLKLTRQSGNVLQLGHWN